MTRVKICGITNTPDALFCEKAGADMLGFVFSRSPRRISPVKARRIIGKLGRRVKKVGVFVNEEINFIESAFRLCGLDFVQLHGDEEPDFVRTLKKRKIPTIKAVRLKKGLRIRDVLEKYAAADLILFDAYVRGPRGGTGRLIDYGKLKGSLEGKKVIVAGGLKADILPDLLRRISPWALDVSSGVEIRPGKKSRQKVRNFLEALHKG